MTYRFLIVDDEYYIRQRVKLCIPWQEYGFEFAGEAASTAQAELILKKTPMDLTEHFFPKYFHQTFSGR